MTTADDKRLLDQVNAANNAGAVAASICDHYWAWVSPAGTRHSARLCMSCHAPDLDWLNEVHAADDTPPDTHSEECVQHRTHGFAACTCTPPDTRSEAEALDGLAQTLYAKDKPPGYEEGWPTWEQHSEEVRDIWRRYARRFLASDWLAQHDAQVAAKALREEADEIAIGGRSLNNWIGDC